MSECPSCTKHMKFTHYTPLDKSVTLHFRCDDCNHERMTILSPEVEETGNAPEVSDSQREQPN